MKQDRLLHSLAHDHEPVLRAAQRLKDAVDVTAATDEFLSFWRAHGWDHLRLEEEIVLPGLVEQDADADYPMLARLLTEHMLIRGLVGNLKRQQRSIEQIRELGTLLESHVRFEERVLFPRIAERLSLDAIGELGADIAAAQASAPGSGRSGSTRAPSHAPEPRLFRPAFDPFHQGDSGGPGTHEGGPARPGADGSNPLGLEHHQREDRGHGDRRRVAGETARSDRPEHPRRSRDPRSSHQLTR